LKNSIAAADQKLQDQRSRLKRNRKEHKTAITAVKKELDTLTNRLANAGGNDERQRQRVLQFNQNIRQAEEAAADFEIQIDMLGDIPDDEVQEATSVKREWRKERDNTNAIKADFERAKSDAERQISSIESDITSVIQKRERLQQRQARVNEQHDKLTAANNEDMSVRQRKQYERTLMTQERQRIENQYRTNINTMERRAADHNLSTAQMSQTIQYYEAYLLSQSQQQHSSVPQTPEGPLPGTNHSMAPQSTPFSAFSYPTLTSAHVSSTPNSIRNGRGRSSSMLSNVSGFTDTFEEDGAAVNHAAHLPPVLTNPFHPLNMMNGRNGSQGSGSAGSEGTDSRGSSLRDPMSPVPSAVKSVVQNHGRNAASPVGGR